LQLSRKERGEMSTITELGPPAKQSSNSQYRNFRTSYKYLIHKLHRFFSLDATDGGYLLVVEKYTIEFISCHKHLWAERCRDELGGRGKGLNHS
jgi:hypothetical protein